MTRFTLISILLFAGLAVSLPVLAVSLFRLVSSRKKIFPLLYGAVSLMTIFSLTRTLVQQSSGIACAMPPQRTLLIYGGITLLHLYFLLDSFRELKEDHHDQ